MSVSKSMDKDELMDTVRNGQFLDSNQFSKLFNLPRFTISANRASYFEFNEFGAIEFGLNKYITHFVLTPEASIVEPIALELFKKIGEPLDFSEPGHLSEFAFYSEIFWQNFSNWFSEYLQFLASQLSQEAGEIFFSCLGSAIQAYSSQLLETWNWATSEEKIEIFKMASILDIIYFAEIVQRGIKEVDQEDLLSYLPNSPYVYLSYNYTPTGQILAILYPQDLSELVLEFQDKKEFGNLPIYLTFFRAKELGLENLSFRTQLAILGSR